MDEATRLELEPVARAVADSRGARAAATGPQLERLAEARAEFEFEVEGLRASMGNALDIRRHGPKLAAIGAGSAFVLLKGPQRVARRVFGRRREPAPLLPKDIEKLVASLGPDGDAVRATLESEFAGYLAARGAAKGGIQPPLGMRQSLWRVVDGVSRPFAARAGWQLAGRILSRSGTQEADRS